jgi:hypothetical protein
MAISDRAVSVLALLDSDLNNKLPIVFICHSYGGLLVKEMLRCGKEIAKEYQQIIEKVRGIVFFAKPHNGSSIPQYMYSLDKLLGMTRHFAMISFLMRPSITISELRKNESRLREMGTWFRENIDTSKIRLRVYFEGLNTYGIRVVDESSSDPHIKGVVPIQIDANHIEICKPLTPDFRVKKLFLLFMI